MAAVEYGFLANLLGFRLKQANAIVLSDADLRLKFLNITPQHFTILAMISINPGIIQTRLIQHIYISRSTCSELIEQLIQKGLIARNPIDRRSFGLSLTPIGTDVLKKAKSIVLTHSSRTTAHMSNKEISELIKLLAMLSEPT